MSYKVNPNSYKLPTKYKAKTVNGETHYNRGGLGEGLGYLAWNVGIGMAGIAEGVTDLVSAAGHAITRDLDAAKAQFLDSWSADWKRQLDDWYNPSATMSFIGDVGAGVGNSLIAALPFIGLPTFFAGAAGGGIGSAAQKTGDVGFKEVGYGLTSGIIEGMLEKYVGPGAASVKGIGTKALSSITKKTAKSAVRNSIFKQVLSNMGEEFLEESLSEMIDPLMQRLYQIDPEASTSFSGVLRAGIIGGISGGILGGAQIGSTAVYDSTIGRDIAANGNSATVKRTAEAVLSSPFFSEENGIKDEGILALAGTLNSYNAITPEQLAEGKGYRLLGAMKRQLFGIEARTKSARYRRELTANLEKTAEYATKFYGKNYTAEDIKADKDGILTHLSVLKWAGDAEIQARAKANVEAARTEAMAKGGLTNTVEYQTAAEMEAAENGTVAAEATAEAVATAENPASEAATNSQAIENLGADTVTVAEASAGTVTEKLDPVTEKKLDATDVSRMTTEQLNERYDRTQERKNELVREYTAEKDEGRRKEINRAIKELKGDMVTINTALRGRGSERYSLEDEHGKITAGMTDAERYEILKNRMLSLSAVVDNTRLAEVMSKLEISESDVEFSTYGDRVRLFKKLGEEFSVFHGYSNSDVELDFSFTREKMRESVSKQRKNYMLLTKMLTCIDTVVENAVGIEVHNRNDQGYKVDNTLNNVYVLTSAFVDGENIIPVKLEVKEFSDNKKNTLHVAIALEGIKIDGIVKQGDARNGVAQQYSPPSDISISQFFKKINPSDESFTKYIPKQFLESEERNNLPDDEAEIAEERAAALAVDLEAEGKAVNTEKNPANASENNENAGKKAQTDSDLKLDERTKRMLGSYEASVVEKARKCVRDFDLLSFERKVAVCELIDTSPNMDARELRAMCVLVASRDGLFAYSSPTKHKGIYKVLSGMKNRRLIVLSDNENVISGEGKGNVVAETIFHEIVHDIYALDKKVFDRLAATAFKHISKERITEIQDRYTEHYTGTRYSEWASDEKLTDKSMSAFLKANPVKENFKLADSQVADIIAEEVVAGYVGKAFADTRYIKYLGDTNPKLFKRVARTFNTLFRRLFGKNRFAERALIDVYAHFTNALAETQVKDVWNKSTVIYERYDEEEERKAERLSLEDSDGKALSSGQAEYFRDSKAVDSQGRLLVLFHQTDAEFTKFDVNREGAGARDNETPHGVFLKPTSEDIGLKGRKQMRLYANITNPLVFSDRDSALSYWKRHVDGYSEIIAEIAENDKKYQAEFDECFSMVRLARRKGLDRTQMTQEERNALIEESEELEDKVLEEWTAANTTLDKKAKALIDLYLKDNGYDGVFLQHDQGSFGRKVQTFIALSSNQVKNTDNLMPTKDEDIRYSLEGETADGRLCYKSDFDSNMSMEERVKLFKKRIATIFNLGAVVLRTSSRKLIVKGDRFTWDKNLYGDDYTEPKEYEAKINSLYDLADILATSKYVPSATVKENSYANPNEKPKNVAHKGVKYWHKFKNEIVFDGVAYTVTFNIRDKGNEQYQYLIDFKENKTPGLSNTAVKSLLRADQASYGNSIHQNDPIVNSSARNNSGNSSADDTERLNLEPVIKKQLQEKTTIDALQHELRDRGVSASAANSAADELIAKYYRQVVSSRFTRAEFKRAIMRVFVLRASAENSAVRFKRDGDGKLQAREQHSKRAFKTFEARVDLLSQLLPQYEVDESMWETVRAAQAEIEMLWNGENDAESVQTYKELRKLYPTVFTASAEEIDSDTATEIIRKIRALKHDDLAVPLSEEQVKAAREAFVKDVKAYAGELSSAMGKAANELKEERRIHGYQVSILKSVQKLKKMLEDKRIGSDETDALVRSLIDRITGTNSEAVKAGDRSHVDLDEKALARNLTNMEAIINGVIFDMDNAEVLKETEFSSVGDSKTIISQYISPELMEEIRACATRVAAKKGERITADEYQLIADMMLGLRKWYQEYDKAFFEGAIVSRTELINKWSKESYEIVAKKGEKTGFKGVVKSLMQSAAVGFLDTHAVWAGFDGYRANGLFTRLWDQLESSMAKQAILKEKMLSERDAFFRKHKKFELELKTRKVKYQNQQITLGEAITIMLTAKREQAVLALYGSDLTVMSLPTVHFKGKGFEATEQEMMDDIKLRIEEIRSQIKGDSAVMEYVGIVERFFNDTSKNIKKNADFDYFGYTNVEELYYIPVSRDKSAFSPDMLSAGGQMDQFTSVANLSFNKHTIKNAKAALVIGNINDLVNNHADGLSKYATMYQAVNTVNRLLGKQITLAPKVEKGRKIWMMEKGQSGSPNSLMKILTDAIWGGDIKKAQKYFRDLLNTAQGFSQKQYNAAQKLVDYITRNATFNVLGLNIKSVMSQLAGIPLAGYAVSPPNLLKGLASMAGRIRDMKAEAELMDRYSEQAHSRNIDGSAVHVSALAEKMGTSTVKVANTMNKISEATMAPISATDRFTFLVVWEAAQYQAEAQGYAIGTEENRKLAGKIVDEFAKMTQPTTSAANSAAARTDNLLAKTFMRFTAATNKMFSRLCEGGARYLTLKDAKKNGLGGVTDKEIKDARSQFRRIGGAVVVSNIMLVGLIQLFKFAFAKDRDEETVMGDVTSDALDSFIGLVPVVSQIHGLISDGYEISDMSLDSINDAFKALSDTGKLFTSVATGEVVESTEIARVVRNSVYNLGAIMGIPIRNTWNNVTGLIKRVSPTAGANINAIFYDPTAVALARALGSENEQLAETVANLMLARRGGKVDYAAAQEFLSLYSTPNDEGELDVYGVMPRTAKEEISVDGKKYILNAKQYKTFKQVYGGVTTALSELVAREDYKAMGEKERAKAVKSLYSLYYSKAATAALGTDPAKSEVISGFVSDITGYVSALAYASGISGDGRKDKILAYLKKSGLSSSDQTWVLASLGYKAEREKAVEQVKRSRLTDTEKANAYKLLNVG